jgi:hypothetical protein
MIDQFKAIITRRGGLAKANRFEVIISLPPGLTEDSGRDLTLLCESTFLPGKQILTSEWAAYGHTIKIPYNFAQEDISCVFNVTNDFYVKRIFDKWQNLVVDNKKFHINYDNVFKADIRIRQLDEQDKVIYEMVLLGAYPISMQPIVLDNNSDQQTQKLSIAFAYNDFVQL